MRRRRTPLALGRKKPSPSGLGAMLQDGRPATVNPAGRLRRTPAGAPGPAVWAGG